LQLQYTEEERNALLVQLKYLNDYKDQKELEEVEIEELRKYCHAPTKKE
jgi:hypothetical protein